MDKVLAFVCEEYTTICGYVENTPRP
jgi:hypothetical protein